MAPTGSGLVKPDYRSRRAVLAGDFRTFYVGEQIVPLKRRLHEEHEGSQQGKGGKSDQHAQEDDEPEQGPSRKSERWHSMTS